MPIDIEPMDIEKTKTVQTWLKGLEDQSGVSRDEGLQRVAVLQDFLRPGRQGAGSDYCGVLARGGGREKKFALRADVFTRTGSPSLNPTSEEVRAKSDKRGIISAAF